VVKIYAVKIERPIMIVLLTDFGRSEYVGIMKAVIYTINPKAMITDLCHNIAAQDLIEAAWVLKNSYGFFPRGAVFCCVVDPGVGTERMAVAVKTKDYYYVSPDNGLLWETVRDQTITDMRQLPIPENAGKTFHGRDVFAKAAANIDLNPVSAPGEQIEEIEQLELYIKGRQGMVVRIDGFGNVVTNLSSQGKDTYLVQYNEKQHAMSFYETYSDAKDNELFLIEGSCKTLEISLKNGNAKSILCLKTGQKINIR
jgi:S-adenosylmethionine hydrolase